MEGTMKNVKCTGVRGKLFAIVLLIIFIMLPLFILTQNSIAQPTDPDAMQRRGVAVGTKIEGKILVRGHISYNFRQPATPATPSVRPTGPLVNPSPFSEIVASRKVVEFIKMLGPRQQVTKYICNFIPGNGKVDKPYCFVKSDDAGSACSDGNACADGNGDYTIWLGLGTRTLVYNVFTGTDNYITKSQTVVINSGTTSLPAMTFDQSNRTTSEDGIFGIVSGNSCGCIEIQLNKLECGGWNPNKKITTCLSENGAVFSFGKVSAGQYQIVPQVAPNSINPVTFEITVTQGQNQSSQPAQNPAGPPYYFFR
jgi:hypothetical protein